jgi:FkbM family methyltransferase
MAERSLAEQASTYLRRHKQVLTAEKRLTRPLRRAPLPIVSGPGRGLRVRFGDSALTRAISRVEPQVEDALLSLLGPGDVFYDVGANIGWYSLLAARAVGPTGRVVAFEPTAANTALLEANITGNRLANATTIAAAVTDENGWATFLYGGSLEGRLSKDDCEAQAQRRALRKRPKRSSIVPVLALDSWIAATGMAPPSVLKIDVEGAEAGVLRGMAETLRSARPALVIELHNTGNEVADLLDEAGYEHAPIESDASTREGPWWAHVLAKPRSLEALSAHRLDAHTARDALQPSLAS